MIAVIFKAGKICIKKLARYKVMFILLLLANYVIWFKVSTDIFLVFALFFMVRQDEEELFDQKISIEK